MESSATLEPDIRRVFRALGQYPNLQPLDFLSAVAFLFLLRWAEHQEREAAAVSEFENAFDEKNNEKSFWQVVADNVIPPRHSFWRLVIDSFEKVGHGFEEPDFLKNQILFISSAMPKTPVAETMRQAAQAFDPLRVPQKMLGYVYEIINGFNLESARAWQEAAQIFDSLVEDTLTQTRYAGEFTTPQQIAELIVGIADPKPGERIYDPCFGVGTVLSLAGRRVLEQAQGYSPVGWANITNNTLHGVELNAATFLIGLTRAVLNGFNQPRFINGNSLERSFRETRDQFDLVLAAPPLGGKVDSRHLYHFAIKSAATETVFMQHIMASLKPNGRAVVALPDGVLFRSGADEKLRQVLLQNFSVEAVVGLPAGIALPYTSINANLIVFRRGEPTSTVWFQKAVATEKANGKKSATINVEAETKVFLERPALANAWTATIAEIEENAFDLTVKRRTDSPINQLIWQHLQRWEPYSEVVQLEDVAEIIGGVGYTRKDLAKDAEAPGVPLIRVTELTRDGEIKKAPLKLDALAGFFKEHKLLQAGDLILSTQGTIGKIGRVREPQAGGIPAHGITTIRLKDDRIQPNYLIRLLQSAPYQEWLEAHAAGTVVKNLSLKALAKLRIPVLSSKAQQSIAINLRAGASAFEFENHIFDYSNEEESALALMNDGVINTILKEGFDEERFAEEFEYVGRALGRVSYKIGFQKNQTDGPNGIIANSFEMFLSDMQKLSRNIKEGYTVLGLSAEFYALMRAESESCGWLSASLRKIQISELLKDFLRKLVEKYEEQIKRLIESILVRANIVVSLENPILAADQENEVQIIFRNESPLPLLGFGGFRLETNLAVTSPQLKFIEAPSVLPAGKAVMYSETIPPQKPGNYRVAVKWRAHRIDKAFVEGDVELSCQVSDNSSTQNDVDLGTNPYEIGSPIDSKQYPKKFFGRTDIIEAIRRNLRLEGSSTVLLLEGNRRTGKSSILNRLQLPDAIPGWIPAYFSFQGGDSFQNGVSDQNKIGLTANEIYYNLTKQIILALYFHGCEFETVTGGKVTPELPELQVRRMLNSELRQAFETKYPFELLEMQAATIKTVLGNRRVVLLLDELDKLQEGIESGITNALVPENLRFLFQKHPHISGILASAQRIKTLREDYWSPFYGIGITVNVGALDAESAERLIAEPVENRLVYSPRALAQVLELTGRLPFLLQLLCRRIFEFCAKTGEQSVTSDTIAIVAAEMVVGNDYLVDIFKFIGNHRRRYVAFLINRLAEAPDRVTAELIGEQLAAQAVEYSMRDLADDLDELQKLDIIEYKSNSYKIKIPLFAEWLKTRDESLLRQLAIEE